MIWSIDISLFPAGEATMECHTYQDENNFEWKVTRVENGFFVAYFGDPYFMESTFSLEVSEGKYIRIRNTGCFFVESTDFDVFYDFRNILKAGYTDEIWDAIEEFLTERLKADPGLTEYEIPL
jgi:hypothetical protein